MVMNRLEHRDFEGIARIQHTERAVAESARSIGAHMDERRHQISGSKAGHTSGRRHQIKIADRLHQPRIGLLLGGDQERPIGRVCDILEQVDRRKDAADNSDCVTPLDLSDGDGGDIDHQPPRSPSRYRRTRMMSVNSPPSITPRAVRPPNAEFGA